MGKLAADWSKRSQTLRRRTVESIEKNIQRDKTPPYIGLFPGTTLTFRESLQTEKPSPQQWPHRAYAELLQADVLPANLANLVIDCMRAYGATTAGVVANVGGVHEDGREILGFISYGYAQMLLRLDRIEEFLLFLYSHRYHVHTRGSWTAGEVTGITGDIRTVLYSRPTNYSAHCTLDAGTRGFGRRPAAPCEGRSTPVGGVWKENRYSAGSHTLGLGQLHITDEA